MRQFLIFTSAGNHSNVRQWVQSSDRSYDLWVTNYSETPNHLKDVADFYNQRKGAKFPNFKHIVDTHRANLEEYDAIMVADDDIIISPKKLDRLFTQLIGQDLWIITPAFSRIGKISHDTTERKLTTRYRFTNFAEVTCPVFKTEKLLDFMDVYDANLSCYGVDWWYLNVLNDRTGKKIVISDENYCVNPRNFHKSTHVREIDKFISPVSRQNKWSEVKENLGISSFKKEIFSAERESVLKIIARCPGYLGEVVFDALLKSPYFGGGRKVTKRALSLLKSGEGSK